MVKRAELLLIAGLFVLLFVNMVYAESWFITEPKGVYSLGDNLEITVKMSESGKQLEAKLNCLNESEVIFLQYIGNDTTADIMYPLTKAFLGDYKGECNVGLKYGDYHTKSQNFVISDLIFLNAEISDQYFAPGEGVEVKGRAEKANGQLLTGFYEIRLPELNLSRSGLIENGEFFTNISIPKELASGIYLLDIDAYQKDGEEIINKGNQNLNIKIKQVPSKIDIILEKQNVKPGNNLSFKIMLYDQTNEKIEGESSYILEDNNGNALIKSLSTIDSEEIFFPGKNFTFGYYRIKAYSAGLFSERQFYLEENEEAEFKIEGGKLTIKNVGNVIYNKAVQVSIAGTVEIINNELGLGEEKEYELLAPKGTYSIKITDGESAIAAENAGLITGRSIAVREVKNGFFAKNKMLSWIFLLLVLGVFIFITSKRTIKKRFVLNDSLFGKTSKKEEKKESIAKELQLTPTAKKGVKIAEHSLVLSGNKQDSAVICLKIKNELEAMTKLNLDSIVSLVHEKNAPVYKSGNYIIPIFSPLITKTFRNHIEAVKTAMELQNKIEEHNKKYKDKIEYGISVHNGNLVSKISGDKMLFTSVEHTITTAKRIADISQGEVLLSKATHEKTIAEVKADNLKKNDMEVFTVKNVIDRDKNKFFMQEFLKRQENEKRKF